MLCPEVPNHNDTVVARTAASIAGGKRSVIIVVAEGYEGLAHKALQQILVQGSALTTASPALVTSNAVVHPSAIDRMAGSELGCAAVDALVAGGSHLMVGIQGEAVVETPFEDTWSKRHQVPTELLALLEQLA